MELSGMEFHAYHGCLEQERREGNLFVVDFKGLYAIQRPVGTDDLKDAADYSAIYAVIAREMEVPSNLLEHVAQRIADAIYAEFTPHFFQIKVTVSKRNPPVGGTCAWSRISAYAPALPLGLARYTMPLL